MASQEERAIHSATEKWPGKIGRSFINMKRRDMRMPRVAMRRRRGDGSTRKKDRQVANHPKAEAMEPTSVTGTRMASPRSSPMRVPKVTPKMATVGER